jgi:hypothetical protein
MPACHMAYTYDKGHRQTGKLYKPKLVMHWEDINESKQGFPRRSHNWLSCLFLTHIKMHVSLYITECSSSLHAIIRKFSSRDVITWDWSMYCKLMKACLNYSPDKVA